MDFRIADTFTDSLSRLTGDEQKSVKTTAFAKKNGARNRFGHPIPANPDNRKYLLNRPRGNRAHAQVKRKVPGVFVGMIGKQKKPATSSATTG